METSWLATFSKSHRVQVRIWNKMKPVSLTCRPWKRVMGLGIIRVVFPDQAAFSLASDLENLLSHASFLNNPEEAGIPIVCQDEKGRCRIDTAAKAYMRKQREWGRWDFRQEVCRCSGVRLENNILFWISIASTVYELDEPINWLKLAGHGASHTPWGQS